jgi:hypothetical protein
MNESLGITLQQRRSAMLRPITHRVGACFVVIFLSAAAVQAAEEPDHVKKIIKHAKEGIVHEKQAIKHLEESVKVSGDPHAKEALEHAKEAIKHAEEALAHAEVATHGNQ